MGKGFLLQCIRGIDAPGPMHERYNILIYFFRHGLRSGPFYELHKILFLVVEGTSLLRISPLHPFRQLGYDRLSQNLQKLYCP